MDTSAAPTSRVDETSPPPPPPFKATVSAPKPLKKRYLDAASISGSATTATALTITATTAHDIQQTASQQHSSITITTKTHVMAPTLDNINCQYSLESSKKLPFATSLSALSPGSSSSSSLASSETAANIAKLTAAPLVQSINIENNQQLPQLTSRPIPVNVIGNKIKRKAVAASVDEFALSQVDNNNCTKDSKQAVANSEQLRLNQFVLDQDMLGKIIEQALSCDSQSSASSNNSQQVAICATDDNNNNNNNNNKRAGFSNTQQLCTRQPNLNPTTMYLSPAATQFDLMQTTRTTNSTLVACHQQAPSATSMVPISALTLPVSAPGLPIQSSSLMTSQLSLNQPLSQNTTSSSFNYQQFNSQTAHALSSPLQHHIHPQHQLTQQLPHQLLHSQPNLRQIGNKQLPFNVDMVSMAIMQNEAATYNEGNDLSRQSSSNNNKTISIRRRSLSTSALNASTNPDEPVDFSISRTYAQTNQNIIDNVIDKLLSKDNPRVMLLA